MTRGEQIALRAMKKELVRLEKIADKKKKEADECCDVGSEMVAIHEEFKAIVDSGEHGQAVLEKLEALQKRRDRMNKIFKKDASEVFDAQYIAERDRDELANEIASLEWRQKMRPGG